MVQPGEEGARRRVLEPPLTVWRAPKGRVPELPRYAAWTAPGPVDLDAAADIYRGDQKNQNMPTFFVWLGRSLGVCKAK